jgi:hypothetical protein
MENMINFAAQQTATTQLDFGMILAALGLAEQPAAEPTTATPVENSLSIVFNDENECEGPVVVTRLGTFRARYVTSASVRFSGRAHVRIESTYGWLFEEVDGDRSDMLLDSDLHDLREACEWLRRNHSVSYAHTNTRVSVTLL